MLEHLNPTLQKPSRVVVLGAYGFVGGTCARRLATRGVAVLPLDKDDIDLTATGAAEQLQTRPRPTTRSSSSPRARRARTPA